MTKTKSPELTLNTLKIIAIIAMTIDHLASLVAPIGSTSYMILRMIGRITAPIMFFAAVEAYHKTSNRQRYLMRLLGFALISQLPFAMLFFEYGAGRLNVIFTILLGVLAIAITNFKISSIAKKQPKPLLALYKTIAIASLVILSALADWGVIGILMMLAFNQFYGNFKHQAFAYSLIVLLQKNFLFLLTSPLESLVTTGQLSFHNWQPMNFYEAVGLFIPLALLNFYHGQQGRKSPLLKWLFYIYYPLHMLILALIKAHFLTK